MATSAPRYPADKTLAAMLLHPPSMLAKLISLKLMEIDPLYYRDDVTSAPSPYPGSPRKLLLI